MCMDIFVGIGKFCGYEVLTCEKFCWVCDVDSWKICMVMILAMWEFLCAWTCGNFYLGHVGIFFFFFAWLWKNLVVVYGYVKNFGCGKIWWHFGEALIFCCGTLTFLGAWEFFGHVILVMGILMGILLDMWFWSWEFFRHGKMFCHGRSWDFFWTYDFFC